MTRDAEYDGLREPVTDSPVTPPGQRIAAAACPECGGDVPCCEASAYGGRHENCSVGVLRGRRNTYGRRLEGFE